MERVISSIFWGSSRWISVDWTFSNLTVRQAYLGGLNLQRVDFSGADLAQSVFTQTLGILFSATFSPCGKYLAIGIGNAVHLWSINDNRPVLTCQGHSGWVQSLAFSPDGQSLASGGHDQSVRIWDVETGQCLKTLKGIKGAVQTLTFSPEGSWLSVGGYDQTIQIWRTKTWECCQSLQGHAGRVLSVIFSPDGIILFSSGEDQTVHLLGC